MYRLTMLTIENVVSANADTHFEIWEIVNSTHRVTDVRVIEVLATGDERELSKAEVLEIVSL